MDFYISQHSGRSYSLRLERGDGRDEGIGILYYERGHQIWKATWRGDKERDTELFGGPASAIRWIIAKNGYTIDDATLVVMLDEIVCIDEGEFSEVRVEHVMVPVYPLDIVAVDEEDDLWRVRLRETFFDHHGDPHDRGVQLGLFGHDDDGWFTVCSGQDKVHGDVVEVLQHLLMGHAELSFQLARMLWSMLNLLNDAGYVRLERKGHHEGKERS